MKHPYTRTVTIFVTVLFLSFSGCGGASYPEDNTVRYTVIVDAGSSGSRLYFYSHTNDIDTITNKFSIKTKPGLSSYTDNPNGAADSVEALIVQLQIFMEENNISETVTIPFNVMATAGMRLVDEADQKKIYSAIREKINDYSFLRANKIKTITGRVEGLYDWLAVNYLSGVFSNCARSSFGTLDLGGASTQIAYEVDSTVNDSRIFHLTIKSCSYRLFSHSFLGLGKDQAQTAVNSYENADNCYPTGYTSGSVAGNFDAAACYSLYNTTTVPFSIASTLLPYRNSEKFIGFSGYYFIADFFGIQDDFSKSNLSTAIDTMCYLPYNTLQTMHPDNPFLPNYCADASHVNNLLYNTGNYNLASYTVEVKNKLNDQEIAWTTGAILYELINGN